MTASQDFYHFEVWRLTQDQYTQTLPFPDVFASLDGFDGEYESYCFLTNIRDLT